MSINYAKFLNVLMIVKMETVQVPIHAHAKQDGLVLIVQTVYACQDVKMASVIYHLNANATLVGQECFVTNQCVNLDVYMDTVMHPENAFATQDGPEKIVQNVCHCQAAIGKMDTAINPWNANANPDITETFANMLIVLMDVILTMVTAFVLILAGVTQAGQVQPVMNV